MYKNSFNKLLKFELYRWKAMFMQNIYKIKINSIARFLIVHELP